MQSIDPQQVCEGILLAEKQYNIEHGILSNENAVVDLLLARGVELVDPYKELYDKLHKYPGALISFISMLLGTVASWSPDKIAKARSGRERLTAVNQQIANKAAELAHLLDERTQLHNHSSFYSDTHYHVCKVIEEAARGNYFFSHYVQTELKSLRGQFDLKYWPAMSDFVRVLATDAERARTEAADPLTAAATATSRSSRADFCRALFAAIEENSAENYGFLPRGFKLTDNTYASLVNCVLNLGPEDLMDGAYVKRLRQRQRDTP